MPDQEELPKLSSQNEDSEKSPRVRRAPTKSSKVRRNP